MTHSSRRRSSHRRGSPFSPSTEPERVTRLGRGRATFPVAHEGGRDLAAVWVVYCSGVSALTETLASSGGHGDPAARGFGDQARTALVIRDLTTLLRSIKYGKVSTGRVRCFQGSGTASTRGGGVGGAGSCCSVPKARMQRPKDAPHGGGVRVGAGHRST
jgi:hypothetical protein